MSRPVVSYDDITLPYDPPTTTTTTTTTTKPHPPPRKKRKRNNNNNNNNNNSKKSVQRAQPAQHWDDPEQDEPEESRELTHDEIWDDSALIDAWNAAMEEYDAYHGPDKDAWKKQPPVHKSPLWYNVPPTKKPSNNNTKTRSIVVDDDDNDDDDDDTEPDSKPIDFDTFVPTHDPSLSAAVEVGEEENSEAYTTPMTHISQDEAFERAVQASYWSGYWTAVYHCQRQNQTNLDEVEAEQEDISSSSEAEEFVSTQR